MKYRKFKNEIEVSLLGLGCMRFPKLSEDSEEINRQEAQKIVDLSMEKGVNYYDTAYGYHNGESEVFLGEALKKYSRDSYYLATKLPSWFMGKEGDMERIFDDQLKKCKTDYFDFYMLHSVTEDIILKFEKYNAYDYLKKMKKEGKIRNLGFSFHGGTKLLEELCEKYEWDFIQLQINYYDWYNSETAKHYEILKKHSIPCIVMEPIMGGRLANLNEQANEILKKEKSNISSASWAMRFAANLPNVITVLSGMSTIDQVKDNVNTINDLTPLSESESKAIKAAAIAFREYFSVPCTACGYCNVCPQGIDIPLMFAQYNTYNLSRNIDDFKSEYQKAQKGKRAEDCIDCKECLPYCPQAIQIPNKLKSISNIVNKV